MHLHNLLQRKIYPSEKTMVDDAMPAVEIFMNKMRSRDFIRTGV
jgi:hypothetical protein